MSNGIAKGVIASDWLAQFSAWSETELEFGPYYRERTTDLYAAFLAQYEGPHRWPDGGIRCGSRIAMGRYLVAMGCRRGRGAGGKRYIEGVRLRPATDAGAI